MARRTVADRLAYPTSYSAITYGPPAVLRSFWLELELLQTAQTLQYTSLRGSSSSNASKSSWSSSISKENGDN